LGADFPTHNPTHNPCILVRLARVWQSPRCSKVVVKPITAALNGKRPTDEYAQKQREEIVRALTECNGRVGGADGVAARMGIHRTTLISRMKKLGIDPRQYAS